MKVLTVRRIVATAFLCFAYASVFGEAHKIAVPTDVYTTEIERLEPYPVTTKSTEVAKLITFLSIDDTIFAGAEIAVCYADGSCYRYVTDKAGKAHLDSAKPITTIIICSFGKNKKASAETRHTRDDESAILDSNRLKVYFYKNEFPMAIDVSAFPADDYEMICVFRWGGISM